MKNSLAITKGPGLRTIVSQKGFTQPYNRVLGGGGKVIYKRSEALGQNQSISRGNLSKMHRQSKTELSFGSVTSITCRSGRRQRRTTTDTVRVARSWKKPVGRDCDKRGKDQGFLPRINEG